MRKVERVGGRWSNADIDPVALTDYDPAWPRRFEEEAAAIRAVLPRDFAAVIEHIGSTAIPGMTAKPIIDILVGAAPAQGWSRLIAPIESLGYVYWADNPRADHLFFVKGMPPFGTGRTHHVHVLDRADEFRDRLLFRDYLRAHPDEAARYVAVKRDLAACFPHDRDGYTDGKAAFVAAVLAKSRATAAVS